MYYQLVLLLMRFNKGFNQEMIQFWAMITLMSDRRRLVQLDRMETTWECERSQKRL